MSLSSAIVISLGVQSLVPSSSLPATSWSRRTVSRRLFSLAPAGVYRAVHVTTNAVGSYPTFSPLPPDKSNLPGGGLFSVARAVTLRKHWANPLSSKRAQELPGSLSMEPGLSSATIQHCRDHPVSYSTCGMGKYNQIIVVAS